MPQLFPICFRKNDCAKVGVVGDSLVGFFTLFVFTRWYDVWSREIRGVIKLLCQFRASDDQDGLYNDEMLVLSAR